ncbi:MAG: hypothetical protein ACRC28_14515 [Clostridium sp.]|uniref:hypothetical protein n=1 Tax=Clostridium sp. TaxID=1506 RepID=UPI003F3ACD16
MVKKLGVILGVTMILGLTGCSVKFGKMDYSERNYDVAVSEIGTKKEQGKEIAFSMNEEKGNVDKINIKMKSGIVTFNESKTDKIVVNVMGEKKFLETKFENKVLEINDTWNIVGVEWGHITNLVNDNLGTVINIELPKGFNKDIDIKMGIGVVILDKVQINEGNISIGVGGILNKELIEINKLDASVKVGAIDLFIANGKDIKTNQETGSTRIILENASGEIEVENKIGEIVIGYLNGMPKCSGSIKLGEKIINENDGDKGKIKSSLNIGQNTIRKINKEKIEERKREYLYDVEIENIIENIS